MSLIPDRYVCSNCGGYDVPIGARHSLSSECTCDHSLYVGTVDDERRDEEPQDTNVND